MVRLALFAAICFLSVLTIQAWIDHPEHFMLDVSCDSITRCGVKIGEAIAQVCKTDFKCSEGFASGCCSKPCSCDDIKAACCPPPPPGVLHG